MNYAWMTAAIASAGIFWNNIRGFFSRVSSFVIVETDVESGHLAQALIQYIRKEYRQTPFKPRRFDSTYDYIRPLSRQGLVGFEKVSKHLVFFEGFKPLFMSGAQNKDEHFTGGIKISFIRGTFDIDQLLENAIQHYNDVRYFVKKEGNTRYYVRKVFGSRGKYKRDNDNSEKSDAIQPGGGGVGGNHNVEMIEYVKWEKEEVGSPISESPFAHLNYPKHVLDFIEEVKRWKNSQEWYKKRSLSWRFGAGLHGMPGSGKTSLVRAVAQELNMPIHIYDLTTMSNKDLSNNWNESVRCGPVVVLFEDIDRIFDENKKIIQSGEGQPLTLDCLLNCISGIEPSDGVLVMVTANDITRLDPALGVPDGKGGSTRNGRLDRHVFFGPLEHEARVKIAERILSDCPHLIEKTVLEGEGETGAQFESRCGKLAITEYWGQPKVYSDAEQEKAV